MSERRRHRQCRGFAAVALVGCKTESNYGGAMRAAHAFGASLIVLERARFRRQATDVSAAWRHVPLLHTEDVFSVIPHDCEPVAVEITDSASSLPQFVHRDRTVYIFGPEDGSVPARILSRCKRVVAIPTRICLNLAATVNVVLYDRLTKLAASSLSKAVVNHLRSPCRAVAERTEETPARAASTRSRGQAALPAAPGGQS